LSVPSIKYCCLQALICSDDKLILLNSMLKNTDINERRKHLKIVQLYRVIEVYNRKRAGQLTVDW